MRYTIYEIKVTDFCIDNSQQQAAVSYISFIKQNLDIHLLSIDSVAPPRVFRLASKELQLLTQHFRMEMLLISHLRYGFLQV